MIEGGESGIEGRESTISQDAQDGEKSLPAQFQQVKEHVQARTTALIVLLGNRPVMTSGESEESQGSVEVPDTPHKEKGVHFLKKKARTVLRRILSQKQTSTDQHPQQEADDPFLLQEKREQEFQVEILQQAQEGMKAVRDEYKDLLDGLEQEGTIEKQIEDYYLDHVVSPQLEFVPDETKEVFLRDVKDYLNQKDSEALRDKVYSYAQEDELKKAWRSCKTLFEQNVLQILLVNLAEEDIASIHNTVTGHLSLYNNRFLDQAIFPQELSGQSFETKLYYKSLQGKDYLDQNMELWEATKSSDRVKEVFSDAIEKRDEHIYMSLVVQSLSDKEGSIINKLLYYPTPDVIRNLAVIAAADEEGHRKFHADSVLNKLSKREDWPALLDSAEVVYPDLHAARSVLEHWETTLYGPQPDLRTPLDSLAKRIVTTEQHDEQLVNLAMESLSINSLIDVVRAGSEITETDATAMQKAWEVLRDITSKKEIILALDDPKKRDWDIFSIDTLAYERELRELLPNVVKLNKEGGLKDPRLDALLQLSQAIVANKTDYHALRYLTHRDVVSKRIDSPDGVRVFFNAYKDCPELAENEGLLSVFCQEYSGQETVDFFAKMASAYTGEVEKKALLSVLDLVQSGKLDKNRALVLPEKAGDIFSSVWFYEVAVRYPQLFLNTDEGLEVLSHLQKQGMGGIEYKTDAAVGKQYRELHTKYAISNDADMVADKAIMTLFSSVDGKDAPLSVNDKNWQVSLMTYGAVMEQVFITRTLSGEYTQDIKTLFGNPEIKDFCLAQLRSSWNTYLASGDEKQLPFSLAVVSDYIKRHGAGPLSHIEAQSKFIATYATMLQQEPTIERTKQEIFVGMRTMEERFERERWSHEDRSQFYRTSQDMLAAAPSLFSTYLELFQTLNPSQLHRFAKEVYPFYRVKLALLEKRELGLPAGTKQYDVRELVDVRKELREFRDGLQTDTDIDHFAKRKEDLVDEVKMRFGEKFGITKIPEEFTAEHIRSLTNFSLYLSNINERTGAKENILALYLVLKLNGVWEQFRRGEEVDLSAYLTPEKSNAVSTIVAKRKELNPVNSEALGIAPEDMPEFNRLLQEETENVFIGDVETIDVKLGNLVSNIKDMADLDLYPDPMDKERMVLLLSYGNKVVGSTAAKMYQTLSNPAKQLQLSEQEQAVQAAIQQILQKNNIDMTPDTIKQYFQNGLKPLSTVVNMLHTVQQSQAEDEVTSLRERLQPPASVIDIFNKIGETFSPTSGAMAVSQDLDYLDSLIVKKEDELTDGEKDTLRVYTSTVREQMIKLQGIYDQIKQKFLGVAQGAVSDNPQLQDKLSQINDIINSHTSEQTIASKSTHDFNMIIENIRECLSCVLSGQNNDTNLTLGDTNKFYLYSQLESNEKGSLSDQVLFLEPVTHEDGTQEMAFIPDRVYGTRSPNILLSQTETIIKKYQQIKKRFPQANLSIFVPTIVAQTGGLSPDMFIVKLTDQHSNLAFQKQNAMVNVAASAVGDHYIEFGGQVRAVGERRVSGIRITLQ